MRTTTTMHRLERKAGFPRESLGPLALAALCWVGAAFPALAQAGTAPPPDAQEDGDGGGAGYLPGARFQRRLEGGPGFVCTATNALRTDQCTASCRKGETADCIDAEGSGTPSCGCTKG